jgi:hypothetical protein
MSEEQAKPLSKLNRLLEFLSCFFQRYPFDETKDSKYFAMLIEEFSDLDIEDELRQYHAWTLDQPDDKKIYYRSRFRSWLKRARDYRTERPLEGYWKRRPRRAQDRW